MYDKDSVLVFIISFIFLVLVLTLATLGDAKANTPAQGAIAFNSVVAQQEQLIKTRAYPRHLEKEPELLESWFVLRIVAAEIEYLPKALWFDPMPWVKKTLKKYDNHRN